MNPDLCESMGSFMWIWQEPTDKSMGSLHIKSPEVTQHQSYIVEELGHRTQLEKSNTDFYGIRPLVLYTNLPLSVQS